jgi:patatin-like phospholipase/acyl hydrolase
MAESSAEKPYRVLTLDGGGAKGFYTLKALREIEGLIGMRPHEKFELIFGTVPGRSSPRCSRSGTRSTRYMRSTKSS